MKTYRLCNELTTGKRNSSYTMKIVLQDCVLQVKVQEFSRKLEMKRTNGATFCKNRAQLPRFVYSSRALIVDV